MTSETVRIREAGFEDYAQITAVVARNGLYIKSRQEWEHFWVSNPVYRRLSKWAIGWVAEKLDQEIVGYVGNLPLSAEFKGREIIIACPNSLVTDPSYRDYGGFLLWRLFNYKTPELIVTSTANAFSVRLFEACRWLRVPAGDWGRAAFWITNSHGFVSSVLSQRGWPKLLSYPGSAILSLRDRFTKSDSWIEANRGDIRTCSGFDERFDVFWDELKRAYPERLLATRSREVLEWHFRYSLAQEKMWIVTVGDNSRLLAYAVFRRRDVPEHGLKRMQLVDFQTLNNDMKILVPMLACAITQCREEGIHTLEAFGFRSDKQAAIESLGPYHRQLPSWWYFYTPVNKALKLELRDPAIWDPSHFDGDASL